MGCSDWQQKDQVLNSSNMLLLSSIVAASSRVGAIAGLCAVRSSAFLKWRFYTNGTHRVHALLQSV